MPESSTTESDTVSVISSQHPNKRQRSNESDGRDAEDSQRSGEEEISKLSDPVDEGSGPPEDSNVT